MKNIDITHELVERTTTMRKEPTAEEGKLWHLYLKKLEPRVKRQVVVGPYIVDFYCSKLKLIIEIDGEQHFFEENLDYEKRREDFLQKEGYKLLRFYNSDINKKLSDTETMIYHSCIDRAKELGVDIPIRLKKRG